MAQYKSRECENSQEYHRNMVIAWEQMMQPLRQKYARELAAIKASERQFFRYEHPDLVREGIVWSHTENAGTY